MTAGTLAFDQVPYADGVRQTRQSLDTIDDTSLVDLTHLGIREIRTLKQEVSEIFPASNLPAYLLQHLVQLEDRELKQEHVLADLRVLFRGSKQIGIYGTFLAAPALVLYGYQRLLALAGKDVDSAFPDGPWQFYTQFGLREDTARHCVETEGFWRELPGASAVEAATSWVYAAMRTLFAYNDLLANEWHERIFLRTVGEVLEARVRAAPGRRLPRKQLERDQFIAEQVAELRRSYQIERIERGWVDVRPYSGPPGAPLGDYAAYRGEQFTAYVTHALRRVPDDVRAEIERRVAERRASELPLYQRQLALLMTLHAESYQERLTPLSPHLLRVALLAHGRYHLIDACARDGQGNLLLFPADGDAESGGVALPLSYAEDGSLQDPRGNPIAIDRGGGVRISGRLLGYLRPPPLAQVKGQVQAILTTAPGGDPSPTDLLLVRSLREHQPALHETLSDATKAELVALRYAPIIINWDAHTTERPLGELRQTQRGTGDHALTLIRSGKRMVFDMSHIFFDALWGMAIAEIMTGFATALYPKVRATRAQRAAAVPPLKLRATPAFLKATEAVTTHNPPEATAESRAVDLQSIERLRKRLPKIKLSLTVNDLLMLARCAHAARYQPGPAAQQALATLAEAEAGAQLAQQIMQQFEEQRSINPALLIPIDAASVDPRLRIYPTTFRNPLPELLPRLERCASLVQHLRRDSSQADQRTLDRERQLLYRDLYFYSELLRSLRDVAMRGKSFTTTILQLMGHLPGAMQHLIDLIPQRIGILNEIIKGREVFSNVGQVAATSSLTRFASARDDGETKTLIWGILTDAQGQLVVTLRDFRPHVAPLVLTGHASVAHLLAQDYVDSYATSVNTMTQQIQRVLGYKG